MLTKTREVIFFRGFYIEVCSRLNKYYNKTLKNPGWLLMSVFGRFSAIRETIKMMADKPNLQKYYATREHSHFRTLQATDIYHALCKDGLYQNINLSDRILQEIIEFAYSTPCYANLDPRLGFLYSEKEKVQKNTTLFAAQYFNTSTLCPAIQALSRDPKLLEIAALYFDAEPVFTGSRLWWNFVVDDDQPYDSNKTITFFHYDLDDYACLRFFFYLTDVDKNSGPHICVRGSHRKKRLSYKLLPVKRRSDSNIVTYYGAEKVSHIIGNQGFGFAEDTTCYHKATRPLDQDRLMLQIQFAMNDYGLHNDQKDPSLLANMAY